jgi:hypothetical protein
MAVFEIRVQLFSRTTIQPESYVFISVFIPLFSTWWNLVVPRKRIIVQDIPENICQGISAYLFLSSPSYIRP